MKVRFELMGLLRMTLGTAQLTVELPAGSRVADALDALFERVEKHSGPRDPVEGYLVLLRRAGRTRSVQTMQGTETPLQDRDELVLTYRFSGG